MDVFEKKGQSIACSWSWQPQRNYSTELSLRSLLLSQGHFFYRQNFDIVGKNEQKVFPFKLKERMNLLIKCKLVARPPPQWHQGFEASNNSCFHSLVETYSLFKRQDMPFIGWINGQLLIFMNFLRFLAYWQSLCLKKVFCVTLLQPNRCCLAAGVLRFALRMLYGQWPELHWNR